MDQLRLILLIIGVLLIAGIFVWELFKKRAHARRREQLVEHLDSDERSLYAGGSLLGDIGAADPIDLARPTPARRSGDTPGEAALEDETEAHDFADYDIDEDFPGEPETETAGAEGTIAVEPTAEREPHRLSDDAGLAPFAGLKARRDMPEQLNLAGLELCAPARVSGKSVPRRVDAAASARQDERRRVPSDDDEELHIIMTVMAKSGDRFSGEALRDALERAGLYHGAMNIFHCHEQREDPATPTLFSVANVLAPGTFEPKRMDSLSSPGIVLFMRLPGPEHPSDAFQLMLDAARRVAEDLDGTLCDESRSTLTPQSINHLRERIADFSRRQMLKA